MKPPRRDIAIVRGDTYTHTINIEIQTEDSSGFILTPEDDSMKTWTAQYRRTPDDTAPVDFAIDTTNAATGVLILRLTAVETATLNCDGVWDLQSVLGDTFTTELAGTVKVIRDVTRLT
jgi:hypothetical protein